MNENNDLLPNLAAQEDAFEVQLRGYSRRQVDEFVARSRSQVRELEERLGRALDEGEQLRQEVKSLRQQALSSRPAHEQVSERMSQILKLADDEAKAQKTRADDDIRMRLADAQQEAERARKEARDQAEHMLNAAQEQAERTISAARAEADKTRNAVRAEADHTTTEARKRADSMLSGAKTQAKQTLDEATARATAIHDGAERRLNLLTTRHGETIRRLTEILDGVSGLVAAETSRLSLEDEVDQNVAKAIAQKAAEAAGPKAGPARTPGTPAGDAAAGGQRGIPGNAAAARPGSAPPRPGNGVRADTPPAEPGRGAHEAPRGGAHEAPRGTRPSAPGQPAGPGVGDRARMTGSGPASPVAEGPGARAGDEMPAGRRPGDAGNGHRATPADKSLTGSIDPDEPTEGVRIVREQRRN